MNLSAWIGLRYLRAKKRNGFMSFISVISIIGIALGTMTLIVVLSVMNGFQHDVRAKLFEVAPHMEMGFYYSQYDSIPSWHELEKVAIQNPHVKAVAPYVVNQSLLSGGNEVRGILLQGIFPPRHKQVIDYTPNLKEGSMDSLTSGGFNLILGARLAEALNVKVGDKVTVITPKGNITPAGMVPRLKQFNVTGIIETGTFEVDNSLALGHISDTQKLFKMGGSITGIRLLLDNPADAPEMTPTMIPSALKSKIWVRDWSFQNRPYFEAVAMEKKMMFVIMAFISLVASFNLVSSLVMTVNEKRSAIAILRTLGLSSGGIMRIFMIQGIVAGALGTFFGVFFGVLIALNISDMVKSIEHLIGSNLVESQVYFLNYIPSDVQFSDVAIIAGISLALAFLATLYPSWRAAKTQPAEALRYE